MDIGLSIVHTLSELGAFSESKISKNVGSCGGNMHVFGIQWEHGGRFLENICTGMLKVDFRMLTISIPVYCKTNKQTNKNRSLYLTCMTKPTHLYTIFTEMMTHNLKLET